MTDNPTTAADTSTQDFGQQLIGYDDRHPWMTPLLFELTFLAFGLMLLTGTAPWQ